MSAFERRLRARVGCAVLCFFSLAVGVWWGRADLYGLRDEADRSARLAEECLALLPTPRGVERATEALEVAAGALGLLTLGGGRGED